MTKTQKQEINDAAARLLMAKGMAAKRNIVGDVWFLAQEGGLKLLAKLVGDTPNHIAYIGNIALLKKNINRIRRHREPIVKDITDAEVRELAAKEFGSERKRRRDTSSIKNGGGSTRVTGVLR